MPEQRAIVVGGGAAGLAASLELAHRGVSVTLLERSAELGGKVAEFCCKAHDACAWCGVCHVDHRVAEVLAHPRVRVLLRSEATAAQRRDDGFMVELLTPQGMERLAAEILLLAPGYEPFDAHLKAPFGYGRYANVITAQQLERILLESDQLLRPSDGAPARSVAFIQCVGSRDLRIGAPYCSQVCCAYALRLAKLLRHRDSTIETSFFYMDIQSPSRDFDRYLGELRREVGLVRGLPGELLPGDEDRLELRAEPSAAPEPLTRQFDVVVLSVGIHPPRVPDALAEPLGLRRNEHGFLLPPERDDGLGVVGTATGPMNIIDSIAHARAVAARLLRARSGARV
jgi:heterodisulfide reductase subunit A